MRKWHFLSQKRDTYRKKGSYKKILESEVVVRAKVVAVWPTTGKFAVKMDKLQ